MSKPKHECDLKADPTKRADADALVERHRRAFPAGLAAPALRALVGAGYTHVSQLEGVSDAELLSLHGMGPKALEEIRDTLRR